MSDASDTNSELLVQEAREMAARPSPFFRRRDHRADRRRRILWIACLLALPFLWSRASRADEFMGLNGLWKTLITAPGMPAITRWHCVVEGSDPWVGFAQLPRADDKSCERKAFEYTSSSLSWTLECAAGGPTTLAGGAPMLTHHGKLVFDSPSHYHGTVQIDGSQLGYPIHQTLKIDGTHHAACTSPLD